MLNELINQLNQRDCLDPLKKADWRTLSECYKTIDETNQLLLVTTVANHTGVSSPLIKEVLPFLHKNKLSKQESQLLAQLKKEEARVSEEISAFKQRKLFTALADIDKLAINRTEWLKIISVFKQYKRTHLTAQFFLDCLAQLRPTVDLNCAPELFKTSVRLKSKRDDDTEYAEPKAPFKRTRSSLFREGKNDYVMNDPPSEVRPFLEKEGVRITSLVETTPQKGIPSFASPGGKKYLPAYVANGNTLYRPSTPRGLELVNSSTKGQRVREELPNLKAQRAQKIEFNVTLESIQGQINKRRPSLLTLMGASAKEVFKAHGTKSEDMKPRGYHWAHIIAHFLGNPENIALSPQEMPVNLIPSTAEANYNTLEAIEQYVNDKLVANETKEILIVVEPVYSGEELIPRMLVYTMTWKDKDTDELRKETCYIDPGSNKRITKEMHQSINYLRSNNSFPASSSEEDSFSPDP